MLIPLCQRLAERNVISLRTNLQHDKRVTFGQIFENKCCLNISQVSWRYLLSLTHQMKIELKYLNSRNQQVWDTSEP